MLADRTLLPPELTPSRDCTIRVRRQIRSPGWLTFKLRKAISAICVFVLVARLFVGIISNLPGSFVLYRPM